LRPIFIGAAALSLRPSWRVTPRRAEGGAHALPSGPFYPPVHTFYNNKTIILYISSVYFTRLAVWPVPVSLLAPCTCSRVRALRSRPTRPLPAVAGPGGRRSHPAEATHTALTPHIGEDTYKSVPPGTSPAVA
jgi:hypothetical protein